jgi:hypothetical protein
MNVAWIGLAVLVVVVAVIAFRRIAAARNESPENPDLGTVSGSWLTENRSRKDP